MYYAMCYNLNVKESGKFEFGSEVCDMYLEKIYNEFFKRNKIPCYGTVWPDMHQKEKSTKKELL